MSRKFCKMRCHSIIICFLWMSNYVRPAADNDQVHIQTEKYNLTSSDNDTEIIKDTTVRSTKIYNSTKDFINGVPPCPAENFKVTAFGHSNLIVYYKFLNSSYYPGRKIHIRWKAGDENTGPTGIIIDDSPDIHSNQLKISSLRENTKYQIIINSTDKYINNTNKHICFIIAKTNLKINSFPTKPNFKFVMLSYFDLPVKENFPFIVRIDWLPCGEKGYCEDGEDAGAYFYVKYKSIYSKQEWQVYEYNSSYTYIRTMSLGITYEVVLTSINDNGKADSDPQEVFIKPYCSQVRSVGIMPLNGTSILLRWKPPLHSHERPWARFIFYRMMAPNEELTKPWETNIPRSTIDEVKITNLSVGTHYILSIIPAYRKSRYDSQLYMGYKYQIDYTPQISRANNLLLAKPDFYIKFDEYFSVVFIVWLPCGRMYDCKNMKPGSYFRVKYKKKEEHTYRTVEETESNSHEIISYGTLYTSILEWNQTYDILVESVDDQSHRQESELKEFNTGHEDDRPEPNSEVPTLEVHAEG